MATSVFGRWRRVAAVVAVAAGLTLSVACDRTPATEHASRGDAHAKEGRDLAAIIEYHKAIEKDEQLGDVHFKLAHLYERLRDFPKAAREYVAAAELLKKDPDVQLKAARMFLLGRRFDEARLCVERALQVSPGDIVAHLLMAQAMAGLDQPAAALASIQKAIALDPTRADTYQTLGVFQLNNGAIEQAEVNLRRAADAQPPSAQARLTLASFYWAVDRLPEAEVELKRAVEAEPDNTTASRALATFYLAGNRVAEAEEHLRGIAKVARTLSARLALADYYIALERWDAAIPLLKSMAAEKNGHADANSRLAAISYGSGATAEAHRIIDETLARDARHPRALLTKATFLMAERKFDEAHARLTAAAAADPRSVRVHFMLGELHSARQESEAAVQQFNEVLRLDPQSIAARMELARLHLAAGRGEVAADLAQEAMAMRPTVDTALLLARAHAGLGDISRAESALQPYLDHPERRGEVLSLAGVIQLGRGEADTARALFERAAAAEPGALEPLEQLVALDLRERAIGQARARAEQRLARDPNNSRLLVLAARTYGAARDAERMIATLRKAIEVDPANTVAYAMLGEVYASQGKLDSALREFEELSRRDPRSVSVNTMAAILLEGLGRTRDARRRYERVLDMNPRAAVAANNLAWMHAQSEDELDQALRLAEIAKEEQPEHPDINDTLGWIYYRRDLPDRAVPPLRLAIERAPANPVYHYHLGLAYLKTGEVDLAKDALEAALKLNPTFDGSADAREALKLLLLQ